MKRFLLVLSCLCSAAPCFSQTNPIVSPEVLPGNRVVFRIGATNAQKVCVFADWMKTGTSEPLARDASGTWSATLGPVKPGIYIYNFVVDGLNIVDPVNPKLKLRARTSASLLEVPGKPSEFWEFKDVPHGTIEINFQRAKALGGETREVWVYKPPGYERSRSREYPVLYLLHGSNDTPAGWTSVGRANFTMDNLLAEKAAREMIIVTPFGHATPIEARDSRNNELFEDYLLHDVIPLIEEKYRVKTGRENRAIAGFSMGGGHALRIGLGHLDLFSGVAALSPGVPNDFETRFASLLLHPEETNRKLKLFWIGCGKDDFLFGNTEEMVATLKRSGIEHSFHPSEGAHTFNVWREYFHEFAPLLFRSE